MGHSDGYIAGGPSQRDPRGILHIIVLAVVAFLIWAANAPLEEVVRGAGRVVPTTETQIVQNLEGGIVAGISVTEGQIVTAGQSIGRMDETQFQSAYQELQEQRLALELRLARLGAEQNIDAEFVPEPELREQAPDFAGSEVELFNARHQERLSTLETLAATAALKRQEAEMLRPMVERNAVSPLEFIRVEQAAVEAEGRVLSAQSEFETLRSQEYSETLVQLRQVEQQIRVREDQLARTNILSPVRGVVNKVSTTTIGGVVRPGDPLVEIIPLDDELRIEGRVDPRDIGFVYVGMPAAVKLTAFDFSIYGTLKGTVVHVGADTVTDDQLRDAAPYYEVYVQVDQTTLEGPGGQVDIRPGMQAEVELAAGEKTVLRYLLKPLFKTTEAFTEK